MDLENKTDTERPLVVKMARVALTTAGYALSTIWFKDYQIAMPLAAAIGFSASLYDELHGIRRRGMKRNLFLPGMGIAVGGIESAMWVPDNTIAECVLGVVNGLFGYALSQEDIRLREEGQY